MRLISHFFIDIYYFYVKIYTHKEGIHMKDIKQLRKMSYYNLKSQYYQLLYNKEIEWACLNENYELFKQIIKSYFIEEGHDLENLKIYDNERQTLKYCLYNIKECKRLDAEIQDMKKKVLKAEDNYKRIK